MGEDQTIEEHFICMIDMHVYLEFLIHKKVFSMTLGPDLNRPNVWANSLIPGKKKKDKSSTFEVQPSDHDNIIKTIVAERYKQAA